MFDKIILIIEFVTATISRQKLLSEERLKIAFEMFDKVWHILIFLLYFSDF